MGQDVATAIAHVDRIGTDCDTIRTEVFALAVDGVMRALGITPDQFEEWFRTRDLDQIEGSRLRDTLAMWRRLLDA